MGTFEVQIAKSFGAAVTGVCSTRNAALVQSNDLIVDTVGNHPLLEYRRVLNPKGIFVLVGAPKRS